MPCVRSTALTPVLAATLLSAAVVSSACGGGDVTGSVEPVGAPTQATRPLDTRPPDTRPLDRTAPPAAPGQTDPPETDPADRDVIGAVAAVTTTLERYGTLLGSLTSEPTGAPAPGSPARAAWDSLVLPGSPLSIELLDRMTRRARDERVVIQPGPGGVSYRHSPVKVDPVTSTSAGDVVDFRWCGWSPGIGRSLDTGEVVDDAVGHATGTGRLVQVDGAWLLAALDQEDLLLLEPGSPDPCPPAPEATGP